MAIENARLFAASSQWIRRLESLGEIGSALVGELDLRLVLTLIVSRVREVVDARLAMIMLPGPDGLLHVDAADGDGAELALEIVASPHASKAGGVMARKRSERIDAIIDDPEVDQANVRALGTVSAMFVPLLVKDRAIGVLIVHDRATHDRRFSESDLRLVQMFATRAAVAIDLSQRVERETLHTFVQAQELERARLARELHDETGQALTAILLGLRSVTAARTPDDLETAVDGLRRLVTEALGDVRALAFELRPKALDDFGLAPALEHLTQTMAARSGIHIELENVRDGRLDGEVETAVYRMVQEALTNVVKHAEASSVSIVLARSPRAITAVIEDDGRGFMPNTGTEGLGLLGMGERLALLGGKLKLESSRDAGTTIVAEVPLR